MQQYILGNVKLDLARYYCSRKVVQVSIDLYTNEFALQLTTSTIKRSVSVPILAPSLPRLALLWCLDKVALRILIAILCSTTLLVILCLTTCYTALMALLCSTHGTSDAGDDQSNWDDNNHDRHQLSDTVQLLLRLLVHHPAPTLQQVQCVELRNSS